MKLLPTVNIFDIPVTSSSESDILEYILKRLENKRKKTMIVTPNPEIVILSKHNKVYQNVLRSAHVSLPDGVGLLWAAKMLGVQLQKRITGVDFMQKLCQVAAERGLTVGLLGGGEGVAERTAKCLKKSYPNLKISYICEEWKGTDEDIDILFVAFGSPKQEMWIHNNLDKIPVKCAMGVGGAFDFISGNVERAPKWMRELGLEWLYRLVRQPWRWRRQLALVKFVWEVLKVKASGK